MALRETIKWLLFPGLNLHARLRGKTIPSYFGRPKAGETRQVLDAGCGNGMLAWHSWKRGNCVLGISIKPDEINRCRRLFNQHLQIPEGQLKFVDWNIYDIDKLGQAFDEIICTEVLEHLSKDHEVIESFRRNLKPGGVLHLCCPNAEHPDNQLTHLDKEESGGHFRSGYSVLELRSLLESAGFRVEEVRGLGGSIRQAINRNLIRIQQKSGFLPGFMLFLLTWPLVAFDPAKPRVPYSIYIQGRKDK
jgi:cyclopropane fatty-acyl-phospholipid synthase-like methyltransferase